MHNIHYIQTKAKDFTEALVKVQNMLDSDESLTSDNYFNILCVLDMENKDIKLIGGNEIDKDEFSFYNIYNNLINSIDESIKRKPSTSEIIEIYKINHQSAYKVKSKIVIQIEEIRRRFNEYIDVLFVNTLSLTDLEYKPYRYTEFGKTNLEEYDGKIANTFLVIVDFHS